ncbi:MAG: hypothetical protein GWP50_04805 [Proteobacteria bacterium]|nr:hypothetical protein [Pseudomonadota bacterium]
MAVMMGGAVAGQGVSAAQSAGKLREQIKDTDQNTAKLKQQFAKLLSTEEKDKELAKKGVDDAMEAIFKTLAQMRVTKDEFNKQKAAIENVGIAMIALCVCMLGYKHFGLLDDVEDML